MLYGQWVRNRLNQTVVTNPKTGARKEKYTFREALGYEQPKRYGTVEQLLLAFGPTAQHVN